MSEQNRNTQDERRELNGQLYNIYGDDLVLERATNAPPLNLQMRDRMQLCFPAVGNEPKSLLDEGHKFWKAAQLWTRRECAVEATRCVMEIDERPCGTLNGFKLYRPILQENERAMLKNLREIVQAANRGEIVIRDWPPCPEGTTRFALVTWPIAVVAAAQELATLEELVIPAGPVFNTPKSGAKAIRYRGLVWAKDLFAGWGQASEEAGGWISP